MTSKKRALRYIREKNHLRMGFISASTLTVSNEMLKEKEFINIEYERLEQMFSKYKLPLSFKREVGTSQNDFFNNTSTLRVKAQIVR